MLIRQEMKARSSKQSPNKNSPKNITKSEHSVRATGLKFEEKFDDTVPKNPLQVGLTAKQHPAQQEFLNVMR